MNTRPGQEFYQYQQAGRQSQSTQEQYYHGSATAAPAQAPHNASYNAIMPPRFGHYTSPSTEYGGPNEAQLYGSGSFRPGLEQSIVGDPLRRPQPQRVTNISNLLTHASEEDRVAQQQQQAGAPDWFDPTGRTAAFQGRRAFYSESPKR